MKLISVNIEGNRHFKQRLLPFLKQEQAQVLCLQEVFKQDLPVLLKVSGLKSYAFVPQAVVTQPNPHLPARGPWGLAILANDLDEVVTNYYAGDPEALPEFFAGGDPNSMNRMLLSAKVRIDDQEFRVATTHFTWSGGGQVSDLQRQNYQTLKKQLASFPELVWGGDLNTPRGGEIFDDLAKIYQDNIPAEVKTTIDKNLHKSGKDIRLVVDALFSSPAYVVDQVRVVAGVSDHMAVVAEVERTS